MGWVSHIKKFRQENPLAVKLLAYILLFSSIITLLSTALQVYLDYRNDLSVIDDRIQQMETTSLDNLISDVWLINGKQIQAQLNDLYQLPDMHYLQLDTQLNERFSAGTTPHPDTPLISRSYPLEHITPEGERYALGTLQIHISLERVYHDLKEKILIILTTQGVKTFLVSIFILYIFWKLVTQHLGALSRYAGTLTLARLNQPLRLQRQPGRPDELSQVVSAINRMRQSLMEDIDKRKQVELALAELNEQLESRVLQRTQELEQINSELSRTLIQLQSAQAQLVESENMAALGSLVAGVAHEINTPLGIGLTTATYLRDQARTQLKQLPDPDNIDPLDFRAIALESCDLIASNLQRAAKQINAFKQVSVDQSSEQRRIFNLSQYLDEVLLSMAPLLKRNTPIIDINCSDNLALNSYPGAFYQIFSNLIQNSLIHGFTGKQDRHIWIDIKQTDQHIMLEYRDSGVGIDSYNYPKIFNPFFTTLRNQGCSGLGLHIVYNLVSQLLQGQIRCTPSTPEQRGAHFQITLPDWHVHND